MMEKEKKDTTGILSKEELLKIGKEKFGQQIQYACPLTYPFSEGNACMNRDCKATSVVERIHIHSEETIYEIDCCQKHAIYFRNTNAIFPFKLGYTPCDQGK